MRRASSASSSPRGPSSSSTSSRPAIPSAFSATSVRKRRRGSSTVGRISSATNSRTASTSSGACGRSCTDPTLGRLLDQVEQLVLHLGGEPPEHGVLDAAVLAAQVPPALSEAADRPLHIAEHLPDAELLEGDRAPGELVVALEVRLDLSDAAEAPVVRAEAPR